MFRGFESHSFRCIKRALLGALFLCPRIPWSLAIERASCLAGLPKHLCELSVGGLCYKLAVFANYTATM